MTAYVYFSVMRDFRFFTAGEIPRIGVCVAPNTPHCWVIIEGCLAGFWRT